MEEVLGEYTRVTASSDRQATASPNEQTSEPDDVSVDASVTDADAETNKTATDGGHTHTPDGDDAVFIDSDEGDDGELNSDNSSNTTANTTDAGGSNRAVEEEDAIIFDDDDGGKTSTEQTGEAADSFNGADETTDEGVLLEDGPGFDDSDVESPHNIDDIEAADGDQGVVIMSRPSDNPESSEKPEADAEGDTDPEPEDVGKNGASETEPEAAAEPEPKPEPDVCCSDCIYAPPANATPLRPGDGCPECGGWLEEA